MLGPGGLLDLGPRQEPSRRGCTQQLLEAGTHFQIPSDRTFLGIQHGHGPGKTVGTTLDPEHFQSALHFKTNLSSSLT